MSDAPMTTAAAERGNPLRDSGDCALIAGALMLPVAIVVATLQPSWMRTTVWLPVLFVLGASAPFIVAGRALHRRAEPWALGAATTLAWITLVMIPSLTIMGNVVRRLWLRGAGGALWYLLGYWLSAWHLVEYVMPTPGYVLLVVLFAACLLLVRNVWGARARLDPAGAKSWWRGCRLVGGYAVIAIPLFYAMSNAQYEREVVKRAQREQRAAYATLEVRKTLRRAQVCLYAYAAYHPNEGYPRNLDALGAAGTACFDSTGLSDLLAHSRVRYAPTSLDGAGRPAGFWLVAEPMTESASWRQQYFADDNGMVYHGDLRGRDDSMVFHRKIPDSPLPPPRPLLEVVDSPVHELVELQRCLAAPERALAPFFPMSIDQNRCTRTSLVTLDDELCLRVYSRFERQVPGGTYVVSYRPRRALSDSTAESYVIEMRPAEYGVDGVRSYWTDDLRRIHWTRENRAATANDSVVEDCELGQACES